jgi:hypothetical protein
MTLLKHSVSTVDKNNLFEGRLIAKKIYADGKEEVCIDEINLVMLSSKYKMLSTLYNEGTYIVDPITSIHVGTGGTIDPLGLYPKTPSQNMTSLYSELVSIPVSFTEDPSVPSVTFISDMGQGAGNNRLITEAGLYTSQGSLFNIKTFIGIPKTSEFSLHFEWTIKLT